MYLMCHHPRALVLERHLKPEARSQESGVRKGTVAMLGLIGRVSPITW